MSDTSVITAAYLIEKYAPMASVVTELLIPTDEYDAILQWFGADGGLVEAATGRPLLLGRPMVRASDRLAI